MGKNESGKSANVTRPSKKAAESAHKTPFRIASDPFVAGRPGEDAHKYEVTQTPISTPAYEELGELPSSYDHDTVFLIARDPQWLFTYWDVNWAPHPASAMKDGERKVYLKVFSAARGE